MKKGIRTSLLLLAAVLVSTTRADDLTEIFTSGETRDLGTPVFFQWVLTPDGSGDYTSCRTSAALPVLQNQVDQIFLTDDGSETVTLPGGVALPFFGTDYSTFYINANGNVSFTSADAAFLGTAVNHFSQPRISASFTDLWPDPMQAGQPVGFIGWKDLGERVAIVFNGVPHRNDLHDHTNMVIEIFHSGPDAGQVRLTSGTNDPLTDANDVLVGLSPGGGVPGGFTETDISAEPVCSDTPETAERFDGSSGAELIDLANKTLCFDHNGAAGYSVTRVDNISALPTDPTGGTIISGPLPGDPILGDDTHAIITPANSVSVHNQSYVNFAVNANGWLTFPNENLEFIETFDQFFAQPAIAGLWNDLNPSVGGTISWKEIAGRVSVTYEDIPDQANPSLLNTFQIEMFTDGSSRVILSYLSMGTSAGIVGISSGPGTTPAGFTETDLSTSPVKILPPTNADYGDLPDIAAGASFGEYSTYYADNGPTHVLGSGVFLGANVDHESDGQPNERALGDDVDALGDDDDGITFLHPLQVGHDADVQVVASAPGFLNAWIDFNGNGDFTDPGEVIASDLFVNVGTSMLNLPATGAVDPDLLYARFRFTSDDPAGTLGPDGPWANGEVEDYALGSISGIVWLDDGVGGGIAGNGLRDEGTPLGGIPVALQRPGGAAVLDSSGNPVTTFTNGEGTYRFTGLSADDYIIHFDAGSLAVAPPDTGIDDSIDSDIAPNGSTITSVIVDEGRSVKNIDAGFLAPVVEFPSIVNTIAEQNIALAVPIPVTTPLPFDMTIPVTYGGTASAAIGGDYAIVNNGTITIPSNLDLTGTTYTLADLFDDPIDEANETLTFTLGAPNFGTLGTATNYTWTVTDNDEAPTLSAAGVSSDENNALAEIVFTVSLNVASGRDITFDYETIAGTATEGDDFLATSGTITILAGQTQATVAVTVTDDMLDEDQETVRLLISGATNANVSPTGNLAIGFIIDDDPPPTLSIADASALEGNALAFVLSLDKASGRTVTVEISTTHGTTDASDFSAISGLVINFAPGELSKTVTISASLDGSIEGEEIFGLIASNAPHPTYLGAPISTGRIFDPSTIISTKKAAWGSTSGWQNWRAEPYAGVVVGETVLSGCAWCSTTGWISLGNGKPADGISYANNSASDYGVNHAPNGMLTGSAWSATTGWISFEQTAGKPAIDRKTGGFSGHAWSSTCGWIALGDLQTASIAIIDSDGDGIDDGWERTNFANDLNVADDVSDQDNDGSSDLAEWITGTNPNHASSYLLVSKETKTGNSLKLTFPTNQNRRYSIEINPGLNPAGWVDSGIGTFDPDAGATTMKTITVPGGGRYFYRVTAHSLSGA